MLRKTTAVPDAEKVPQSVYGIDVGTTNSSSHTGGTIRNIKQFTTARSRSSSRDTWISQILPSNTETKRDGYDTTGTNKQLGRCSTIRILRIAITFLLIGIVALSRLMSNKSNHRHYTNWITNIDKEITGSIIRLLSIPKYIVENDAVAFEYAIYCNVTTDVRGNLGPAAVLIQNQTQDWINDRWQAASDMHGTNIHGQHYVQLDWSYDVQETTTTTSSDNAIVPQQHVNLRNKNAAMESIPRQGLQSVTLQRIVLDWEAAYSDNYDIQIWQGTEAIRNTGTTSLDSSVEQQWMSIFTMRPTPQKNIENNQQQQQQQQQITDVAATTTIPSFITTGGVATSTEFGQSPGVTFTTPLHVMHDIILHTTNTAVDDGTKIRSRSSTPSSSSLFDTATSKMRIVIHTSATGWGVSLWQVQVYGDYALPITQ